MQFIHKKKEKNKKIALRPPKKVAAWGIPPPPLFFQLSLFFQRFVYEHPPLLSLVSFHGGTPPRQTERRQELRTNGDGHNQ